MAKNRKEESRGKKLDVEFKIALYDDGDFFVQAKDKGVKGKEISDWSRWEDLQKLIRKFLGEFGLVVHIKVEPNKSQRKKEEK